MIPYFTLKKDFGYKYSSSRMLRVDFDLFHGRGSLFTMIQVVGTFRNIGTNFKP